MKDNNLTTDELRIRVREELGKELEQCHVNVKIEERDAKTGKILSTREVHNTSTQLWKNNLAAFTSGGASAVPGFFAVGTGTPTTTALGSEKFRDTIVTKSASANQATLSYTLGTGSANGNTLTEAGMFDAASGGGSSSGYTQIPSTLTSMPTIYQTIASGATSGTIQTALNNCPTGQCVMLGAGSFTVNSLLQVPASKYLIGTLNGDGTIGTTLNTAAATDSAGINFAVQPESLSITKLLKLNGVPIHHLSGAAPSSLLVEDIEYTGIDAMYDGSYSACGVHFDMTGGSTANQFNRVTVTNAHSMGFLLHCLDASTHSNWVFKYCKAIGCGKMACTGTPNRASSYWPCGFDFFESSSGYPSCNGMTVTDCTANGNYCDGFHTECATHGAFAYDHCTASNNGQYYNVNYSAATSLLWTGFGYMIGEQDSSSYANVTFTNNAGSGNMGRPADHGTHTAILWCYGGSGATDDGSKTGTNWNGTGSGPRSTGGSGSGGGNLFFSATYTGIAKTSANSVTFNWVITFS